MARAAAPMLRGLRVPTRTTRRFSSGNMDEHFTRNERKADLARQLGEPRGTYSRTSCCGKTDVCNQMDGLNRKGDSMKTKMRHLVGATMLGGGGLVTVHAQTAAVKPANKIMALDEIKDQAGLEQTIAALDAKLFDAYNHCDLKGFGDLVADDVEFYHDQGGVTLGREKLVESIQNNICTGDT